MYMRFTIRLPVNYILQAVCENCEGMDGLLYLWSYEGDSNQMTNSSWPIYNRLLNKTSIHEPNIIVNVSELLDLTTSMQEISFRFAVYG